MNADTSQALISIAMCTYQGEAYLAAQLESLLAQTWQNLEIVVVDDGSTDGTVAIVEKFARLDARVKLHQNPINLGINANFSRALGLCQGQFIAPCDQDDVWHPEKLARLHACLGPHLMAYCDSELITAQGESMNMKISDRIHMAQGHNPLMFAFWNCISGHAMLFRRELLTHALPIPPVKFHDWWLAFWAASVGNIQYIDQPLVQYRQHVGGQTDLARSGHKKEVQNRYHLFQERCQWFSYLAQVPQVHQRFFQTLYHLYQAQSHQWFSFELVQHLRKQADALLFINKKKSFFRFALKNFWGMKAKAFFSPHHYHID
jgi:glycosyltransferase involved in cell wall biosynthesis